MFKNLPSRGLRTLFLCLIVFLFGSGKLAAQNSLDLSGASNSVDISYNLNISGFTVETWIYMNAMPSTNAFGIFTKANSNLANPLDLYINADGTISMWMGNGGATLNTVTIATLTASQWYHIAVTYDPASTGAEGKLYIDGVEEASLDAGTLTNSLNPLRIGDRADGQTNADALFDDFRVWSTVRTASQIENYKDRELFGTEGALDVYLPMNGNLNDLTGNGNNGTDNSSNGFSITVPTLLFAQNNALHFNGTDNFVSLGSNASLQLSTGTLEAWIKTTDAGSSYRGILVASPSFSFYLKDNQLTAYQWSPSTDFIASGTVNDDTWHHVAMTFDDGVTNGSHLYLDGVEVLEFTYNVGGFNVTNGLILGANHSSTEPFNGTIDEVMIWNDIRTQGEIQSDAQVGIATPGSETNLVSYYKFDHSNAEGNNSGITSLSDEKGVNDGTFSASFPTTSGAISNFVASTQPALDLTAPVLSYDGYSNLRSTNVDFEITVNEESDLHIVALTDDSYPPSAADIKAGTDANSTPGIYTSYSVNGNNGVAVSGLTPSTVYHIYLYAEDAANNESNIEYFTVTTEAPDVTVPTLTIGTIGTLFDNRFDFNVNVDEESSVYTVALAANNTPTQAQIKAGTDGSDAPAVYHSGYGVNDDVTLRVDGLAPATTYYIYTYAEDYSLNESDIETFSITTAAADDTDPILTVDGISTPFSSRFDFDVTVDEESELYYVVLPNGASAPSSAQIKAGTDGVGSGAVLADKKGIGYNGMGDSRNIVVTGLTPSTPYEVYVFAEDNSSNLNPSNIETFSLTTAAPDGVSPVLSVVGGPIPNGEGFAIDITVDEECELYYVVLASGASAPSAAQILAGTDGLGQSAESNGYETVNGSQTINVGGLSPITVYDVYVVAQDYSNNLSNDENFSVTTTTIADLVISTVDVPGGSLVPGSTNNLIYKLEIVVTNGTGTMEGMYFKTTESDIFNDFDQFHFKESTGGVDDFANATLIESRGPMTLAEANNFNDASLEGSLLVFFNSSYTNETVYLYISADVSSSATDANTIVLDLPDINENFGIESGNPSDGGLTASNLFTINSSSCATGEFIGTVDSDVTNSANWCNGIIPDNTADVTYQADANVSESGYTLNGGSVTVAGGTNLVYDLGGLDLDLTNGTFTNNGTVIFTNTGNIINGPNFTNNGFLGGEFTCTGSFTNGTTGTVSPGFSPGCMVFGSGYNDGGGTLDIEIDGATAACDDYDQLQVTGTATLSGTLNIDVQYAPADLDQIILIDADEISGAFTTTDIPENWTLRYDFPNAGEVSLTYNEEGSALTFDGTDDYFTAIETAGTLSDATIEMWVSHTVDAQEWLYWRGNASDNNGTELYIEIGGALTYGESDGTYESVSTANLTVPSDGTWTHVAVVKDGDDITFYVNGEAEEQTVAFTGTPPSGEITIGARNRQLGQDNFFTGQIDEVRIWKDKQDPTSIRQLATQQITDPTDESTLLAYYDLNRVDLNASVGTIPDKATDGTNQNGANDATLEGYAGQEIANSSVASTATATPQPVMKVFGGIDDIEIVSGAGAPAGEEDDRNFWNVQQSSESKVRIFEIENHGVGTLDISGGISFSNGTDLSYSGPSLTSLAPGQKTNFSVTYTPTTVSTMSDVVNITNTYNTNYDFSIAGEGVNDNALHFVYGANAAASADYISVAHDAALNIIDADFTIEAWVYLSDNTNVHTIISKGAGNGAMNDDIFILGTQGSTGNLAFNLSGDGSTTNSEWVYSGSAIPLNTWTHVAVVFDAVASAGQGEATFYINGADDGTVAFTNLGGGRLNSDANPMYIGRQGSGCNCNYWDGSLDDIRIWTTARTPEEISHNFSTYGITNPAGLLASYDFNEGTPASANNGVTTLNDLTSSVFNGTLTDGFSDGSTGFALNGATSNWIAAGTATATTPEIEVISPLLVNLVDNAAVSVGDTGYGYVGAVGYAKTFTINNTGVGSLSISSISTSGTLSDWSIINTSESLPALIAGGESMTFDILSGSDVSQVITISSNDDDEEDFEINTSITGIVENALEFDGTGDHVEIPYDNTSVTAYTMEAWINVTDLAFDRTIFYSTQDGNEGGAYTQVLAITTGGVFEHYVWDGAGKTVTGNTVVTPGQWYHVAITGEDSENIRLFVNGVEDGTPVAVGTFTPASDDEINIGLGVSTWSNNFNGQMDEFRMWDVARSEEEIQTNAGKSIREAAGLIASYDFNNAGSGTTLLRDITGNGLDGTLDIAFDLDGTDWVPSTYSVPEIKVESIALATEITDASTLTLANKSVSDVSAATYVITITNTGAADLDLTANGGLSFGAGSADIMNLSGPTETLLAFGESTEFSFDFQPSTGGAHTKVINIGSNDADESAFSFTVEGNGLVGPANVADDIALWLRADVGVVSTDPVTSWEDQSGTGVDFAPTGNGPEKKDFGYQTSVFFDYANSEFLESTATGVIDGGAYTKIAVVLPNRTVSSAKNILSSKGTSEHAFYIDGSADPGKGPGILQNGTKYAGDGAPVNYNFGTPIIVTGTYDGATTTYVYMNGALRETVTSTGFTSNSELQIGAFDSGAFMEGDIAEIIAYNRHITNTELQKVESYLAMKYGIAYTGGDYLSSASTQIWQSGLGYDNGIIGIGRDDASNLNTKQSYNLAEGKLFEIGAGEVAVNNAANGTALVDESFIVMGHNGADMTYANRVTASLPTGVSARMDRVYFVQERDGDITDVDIKVDMSATNGWPVAAASNYVLLLSDDDVFWVSATETPATSYAGGIATFEGVDLSNNKYLAVAFTTAQSSDIVTSYIAPTTVNYSDNVGTDVDVVGTGLGALIGEFTIRDGGGSDDGDALGTTLDAITLQIENLTSTQIASVALYNAAGDTEHAEVTLTGVGNNEAVFTGLSAESITAAGNATPVTFRVYAAFNDLAPYTDQSLNVGVSITSASAVGTGSGFATITPGATFIDVSGGEQALDVVADRLEFTSGPAGTVGLAAPFSITVEAQDAAGNLDTDNVSNVTISENSAGPGTLTAGGGLARALVGGTVTYADLEYDAIYGSLDLAVDDNGALLISDLMSDADGTYTTASLAVVNPGTTTTISAGVLTGIVVDADDYNDVNTTLLGVWDFDITDAGDDGLDTKFDGLTITNGSGISNWDEIIAYAELDDDNGSGPASNLAGTINANSIVFSSIGTGNNALGRVDEGTAKTFTLSIYLRTDMLADSLVIDNEDLEFVISETSFNALSGNSGFAANTVTSPLVNLQAGAVTQLVAIGDPTAYISQREDGIAVTVGAADQFGNIDTDYSASSSLTISTDVGTIESGDVTASLTGGYYTTNLVMRAPGTYDVTVTETEPGVLSAQLVTQTTTVIDTRKPIIKDSDFVVNLSPSNGESAALAVDELTMTFSENVVANVGNIKIYDLNDISSTIETISVSNVLKVGVDKNIVTVSLANLLEKDKTYFVTIDNTAFQDAGGNKFDGISGAGTWSFTTKGGKPVVANTTPGTGATLVSRNSNITIVFDEEVTYGTGNITLVGDGSTNITIDATSGEDGGSNLIVSGYGTNTIVINPQGSFDSNEIIDVEIPETAFAAMDNGEAFDADGDDLTDVGVEQISFTTLTTADVTGPVPNLTAGNSSPYNGETGVLLGVGTLIVKFDEAIQAGSGSISLNAVTNPDIQILSFNANSPKLTYNGDQLEIDISAAGLLSGTVNYYVEIQPGAVEDILGNPTTGFSGSATYAFTTQNELTPPGIAERQPADNASDVSTDVSIGIRFNEPVVFGPSGTVTLYLSASGEIVEQWDVTTDLDPDHTDMTYPGGTLTLAGNLLRLNRTNALSGLTGYNVRISTGALEDFSGNDFAGILTANQWNFTTGAEAVATFPELDLAASDYFLPNDGSTTLTLTPNISFKMTEPVNAVDGQSITIYDVTNSEVFLVLDATDFSIDYLGKTIEINNVTFDYNTEYYIEIPAGAVEDNSGNATQSAIGGAGVWQFTTLLDQKVPEVVSLNVSLNTAVNAQDARTFIMSFNEPVQWGTGAVKLYYTDADVAPIATLDVTSQVNVVNHVPEDFDVNDGGLDFVTGTWTANGAALAGSALAVGGVGEAISIGAVNNNNFVTPYIKDITGVQLDYRSAGAGACEFEVWYSADGIVLTTQLGTAVNTSSNTYATFSETMPEAMDGHIIVKSNGNAALNVVIDNFTYISASSLSFELDLPSGGTGYYITVDNGAITDVTTDDDNAFEGYAQSPVSGRWRFTTNDDGVSPSLLTGLVLPADDAATPLSPVDVTGSNDEIFLVFDELVSPQAGKYINIYYLDNDHLAHAIAVNSATPVVVSGNTTFTYDISDLVGKELTGGTEYYFTLEANAFLDEDGTPLGNLVYGDNTTWNIITTGDNTVPTIVSKTPADDDLLVNYTTNSLQIDFSERVTASAGGESIQIVVTSTNEVVATIPANTGVINNTEPGLNGSRVTYTVALSGNTAYHLLIDPDAFVDADGNSFAGIISSTTWNFKTTAEPDAPANRPNLVGLTPAVAAYDITYSGLTGSFAIGESVTSNGAIGAVIANSGTVLTVSYTYQVENIIATNTITGATSGATATIDGVVQKVTASTFAINTDLVLTFDEPVTTAAGTVTIQNADASRTQVINVNNGSLVSGSGTNVITIDIPQDLDTDNLHTVLISGDAFRDGSSLFFEGAVAGDWQFTTQSGVEVTAVTGTVTACVGQDPVLLGSSIFIDESNVDDFGIGTDVTYEISLTNGFYFDNTITPDFGTTDVGGDISAISHAYINSDQTLQLTYTVGGTSFIDQIEIGGLSIGITGTSEFASDMPMYRSGGTALQFGNETYHEQVHINMQSDEVALPGVQQNNVTICEGDEGTAGSTNLVADFDVAITPAASHTTHWYANADYTGEIFTFTDINAPTFGELGFVTNVAGTQTVYVSQTINATGCESQLTPVTVTILAAPNAEDLAGSDLDAGGLGNVCSFEQIELGKPGNAGLTGYTFIWGGTNVPVSSPNPKFNAPQNTDVVGFSEEDYAYTLDVIDNNQCQSLAQGAVNVRIDPRIDVAMTAVNGLAFTDNDTDGKEFRGHGNVSGFTPLFTGTALSNGDYSADPATIEFNPSLAGDGTFPIRYILKDNTTGCSDTTSYDIVVNQAVAIFSNAPAPDHCESASDIALVMETGGMSASQDVYQVLATAYVSGVVTDITAAVIDGSPGLGNSTGWDFDPNAVFGIENIDKETNGTVKVTLQREVAEAGPTNNTVLGTQVFTVYPLPTFEITNVPEYACADGSNITIATSVNSVAGRTVDNYYIEKYDGSVWNLQGAIPYDNGAEADNLLEISEIFSAHGLGEYRLIASSKTSDDPVIGSPGCAVLDTAAFEILAKPTAPLLLTDLSGIGGLDYGHGFPDNYALEFNEGDTIPDLTAELAGTEVVRWYNNADKSGEFASEGTNGSVLDSLTLFNTSTPNGGINKNFYFTRTQDVDINSSGFAGCQSDVRTVNMKVYNSAAAPIINAGALAATTKLSGNRYIYEYCEGDPLDNVELTNNISDTRSYFFLLNEAQDTRTDVTVNTITPAMFGYAGALDTDITFYIVHVKNDSTFLDPSAQFAGTYSDTTEVSFVLHSTPVDPVISDFAGIGDDDTYKFCVGAELPHIETPNLQDIVYRWARDNGSSAPDLGAIISTTVQDGGRASKAELIYPSAGWDGTGKDVQLFHVQALIGTNDESGFAGCPTSGWTPVEITVYPQPSMVTINEANDGINANGKGVFSYCRAQDVALETVQLDSYTTSTDSITQFRWYSTNPNGLTLTPFLESSNATAPALEFSDVFNFSDIANRSNADINVADSTRIYVTQVTDGLCESPSYPIDVIVNEIPAVDIVDAGSASDFTTQYCNDYGVVQLQGKEGGVNYTGANDSWMISTGGLTEVSELGHFDPNAAATAAGQGQYGTATTHNITYTYTYDYTTVDTYAPISCSSSVTKTITVHGLPDVDITNNTLIDANGQTLTTDGAIQICESEADFLINGVVAGGIGGTGSFSILGSINPGPIGSGASTTIFPSELGGYIEAADNTLLNHDFDIKYEFTTTTGACVNSIIKTVTVDVLPEVQFEVDGGCIDPDVQFHADLINPATSPYVLSNDAVATGNKLRLSWQYFYANAAGIPNLSDPYGSTTDIGIDVDETFDLQGEETGTFAAILTATSELGCESEVDELYTQKKVSILIDPSISFKWKGVTAGDQTEFIFRETLLNLAQISQYAVSFDSGAVYSPLAPVVQSGLKEDGLDVFDPFYHTFNTPGKYDVALALESTNICYDTLFHEVNIIPLIDVASLPDAKYEESFNVGEFDPDTDGWYVERLKDDALSIVEFAEVGTLTVRDHSWVWGGLDLQGLGLTDKQSPGDIASANLGAWSTTRYDDVSTNPTYDSLNYHYLAGEDSWLYTPAFDLSGLSKPMVQFNMIYDFAVNQDGVVFQYSLDEGNTWTPLGSYSTDTGISTGLEWYNFDNVQSDPGQQSTSYGALTAMGWSGTVSNPEWVSARHRLDHIPDAERGHVRFRFAISGTEQTKDGYFGFALDDFSILERSKNVMIEQFVSISDDADATALNTATASLKSAIQSLLPSSGVTNRDEVILAYHTDFGVLDPFNAINPSGPSARSIYYNVDQVTSILDGQLGGTSVSAKSGDLTWTANDLNLRSLRDPGFEIVLTADPTATDAQVKGTIAFKANQDFAAGTEFRAYAVILEDTVITPVGGVGGFSHVMRKLLPSGSGKYVKLSEELSKGEALSFGEVSELSVSWDLANIRDDAELSAIIFIQNSHTKEIYQSVKIDNTHTFVGDKNTSTVTDAENLMVSKDFNMYPNPTDHEVFILFDHLIQEDMRWTVFDQSGRVFDQGEIRAGKEGFSMETTKFPSGLYYMSIRGEKSEFEFKKLMVTH